MSYRDRGLHVGSLRADVAYLTKEAHRTRAAFGCVPYRMKERKPHWYQLTGNAPGRPGVQLVEATITFKVGNASDPIWNGTALEVYQQQIQDNKIIGGKSFVTHPVVIWAEPRQNVEPHVGSDGPGLTAGGLADGAKSKPCWWTGDAEPGPGPE
jgi:hypothetical protein